MNTDNNIRYVGGYGTSTGSALLPLFWILLSVSTVVFFFTLAFYFLGNGRGFPIYLLLASAPIFIAISLIGLRLTFRQQKQAGFILQTLEKLATEDFKSRTPVLGEDGLGNIADQLNRTLDRITVLVQTRDDLESFRDSMIKLLMEISTLQEGDLTVRAEVTEDSRGVLAHHFNTLAERLEKVVAKTSTVAHAVKKSATKISGNNSVLIEKNLLQAKNATSVAHKMLSVLKTAQKITGQTKTQQTLLKDLQGDSAGKNSSATALASIDKELKTASRGVMEFQEKSLGLAHVAMAVDKFSEKATLLSLNDSIENSDAPRQHDLQKADEEIKKLAEISSRASKELGLFSANFKGEVLGLVKTTKRVHDQISSELEVLQQIHESTPPPAEIYRQLTAAADEIRNSAAAVEGGLKEIVLTLKAIPAASRESALSNNETLGSMKRLVKTADHLLSFIDQLNLTKRDAKS
ncbi:methyl-accepting chemotaxis protein [Desulforhopalus singaporensis]|uniref:Methyl-accepting chemotaxis protein n=1 Tax=Desulforhopalus singaporensis TaxID=91360 RepID=A0A1H0RK99_9BACT|nr:methyl-accepting chemotaxis protein [Desulforhopalus singaporensis]SDP29368.1 Methyl-accepting chemotaxis protein [Desulforhopalus singaporensis]